MAYNKKAWADRNSEFPNRRQLIPTETEDIYLVQRAEGLVARDGDPFSAATMNDMEARIAAGFAETVQLTGDQTVLGVKNFTSSPTAPTVAIGTSTTQIATTEFATVTGNQKMPYTGGTFTGIAYAQSNTSYTTGQIRNAVLSTSEPSGGSNGMLWFQYT